MLRILKFLGSGCVVCAAIFALPAPGAQQSAGDKTAQTPSLPPPAPVPVQISTARKAFISNLGGDLSVIAPDHYSGIPTRIYDEFYALMKSWGRYELLPSPAGAELFFEISFAAPSHVFNGSSSVSPQFILVIRDTETRAVLWKVIEHLDAAHATHDQQFDQAMAKIVDDVKRLSGKDPAKAPDHGGN